MFPKCETNIQKKKKLTKVKVLNQRVAKFMKKTFYNLEQSCWAVNISSHLMQTFLNFSESTTNFMTDVTKTKIVSDSGQKQKTFYGQS